MVKRVIGIDPGLTGGLSVLEEGPMGPKILALIPMPTYKKDKGRSLDIKAIDSFLSKWINSNTLIAVEEQFILSRQGGAANKTIYENMGMLKAVCLLNNKTPYLIKPKVWQDTIPSYSVPAFLNKWKFEPTKLKSIIAVINLFPNVNLLPTSRSSKPSDGLADCILIALYLLTL